MGSQPIGISASRGAAILGLSNYKSPIAAWIEICEQRRPGFCAERGYALPERADSAAIRFGHAFEDAVIMLAQSNDGRTCQTYINDREKFFQRDFLTCHLDGIYETGEIHEGKTTNLRTFRANWGEPGTDQIPREYQVQVQHQMLCSGIDNAIVSVLVFPLMADEMEAAGFLQYTDIMKNNMDTFSDTRRKTESLARSLQQIGLFHQYPVAKNERVQNLLLEKYTDFWNNYVLTEICPPVTIYDDVKLLIPSPTGEILASDRLEELAGEYGQISAQVDLLKSRQDEIKTEFARVIAEAPKQAGEPDKISIYGSGGRKIASYNRDKRGVCMLRIPKMKEEF